MFKSSKSLLLHKTIFNFLNNKAMVSIYVNKYSQ